MQLRTASLITTSRKGLAQADFVRTVLQVREEERLVSRQIAIVNGPLI